MKARVISIESGSAFVDKQRRVTVEFADADWMYKRLRLTESALGIAGLKLDDELDVGFMPVGVYVGLHDETLRSNFKEMTAKAKKEGLLK